MPSDSLRPRSRLRRGLFRLRQGSCRLLAQSGAGGIAIHRMAQLNPSCPMFDGAVASYGYPRLIFITRMEAPMPEISPKVTRTKLQRSARKTSEGRGRASLPGVKTDAKHVNATDKCGYGANRQLAKLIEKAMRSAKKTDKGGQHFVLGWRLYPNKSHPRWKNKDVHSCGCGCGCSA
jgi:hypothetical protein